jgi:hypothetical protein
MTEDYRLLNDGVAINVGRFFIIVAQKLLRPSLLCRSIRTVALALESEYITTFAWGIHRRRRREYFTQTRNFPTQRLCVLYDVMPGVRLYFKQERLVVSMPRLCGQTQLGTGTSHDYRSALLSSSTLLGATPSLLGKAAVRCMAEDRQEKRHGDSNGVLTTARRSVATKPKRYRREC